ncbi:hypothetical protein ACFLZ1_00335 [Patescibacteria group bacterium]
MKKTIFLILIFCFLVIKPTYAADSCTITNITQDASNNIIVSASGLDPNEEYAAETSEHKFGDAECSTADGSGNLTITLPASLFSKDGSYEIYVGPKVLIGCAIYSPWPWVKDILCKATIIISGGKLDKVVNKVFNILKPTACIYEVVNTSPPSMEFGIETALGCFPTSPKGILGWFLKWALMFAGGIAFLLMLWGAFQIIMSSGDPEKIKKGQETLFSALAGLLMIIFAVFILRLLGVTILQIPGWT